MTTAALTSLLPVKLTEAAARHVIELVGAENPEQKGLRIYVEKGGCSGLSYSMELATAKPDDTVFPYFGTFLYVDSAAIVYLAGSEIDYQDGLTGAGFRIKNPNAKQTCGCGTSFEA
jgi:iron-sulfur cluster assembly accessory protein